MTIANINAPRSAFVDHATGRPSREWLLYLYNNSSDSVLSSIVGGPGVSVGLGGGIATISLNVTGVSPGTYPSDAGHVPLVTVNAEGQVTAISSEAIVLAANSVTNASLAQGPAFTIKGNNTGATANEADLTVAQVLTMLGVSATSSGTYTPTLTNVANVASSSALQCQYMQVGSVVTVSGQVSLTPTAASTLTQLGVSLPVPSNFVNPSNVAGAANATNLVSTSAGIIGDTANHRAQINFIPPTNTAETLAFTFTYLVV